MRLQDAFRGWSKAHGQFIPGATSAKGKVTKKSAATVKGEATDDDWARHLAGEAPGIGIIPLLDDDESVWWGAIDIDVYNVDHAALERKCENLPLVFSKSKSGGAHVWLFCAQPTPATLVNHKLAEVAAYLGHGGCEIFPKQMTRSSDRDTGNWINMPYYGESRWGVLMGETINLSRFLTLIEARRANIVQIMGIDVSPATDWFNDGPPCLQHLHKEGFTEGSRNNGLFNVGVYLRNKNPNGWERDLLAYNNEEMADPLPSREVQGLADNVRRKEYAFTCNQPPIQPHCNKGLCQKREYGIGGHKNGGAGSDELDVEVGRLTKYDSQPPMWVIEVNGVRFQVETDDLIMFGRFQKACVEHCNTLPNPVKPAVWSKTVQGWLKDVDVLPAPPDASPEGQFMALVTEFIRDRHRETKEEMTLGNVWIEHGWAHFRSSDLIAFVRRQAFTNFTPQRMYAILHQSHGGQQGKVDIKGAIVDYWKIQAGSLQIQEHDTPDFNSVFDANRKDST
jgi:hypothetical protein